MPDPLIGALEHKIPGIHIKNFGILIFSFSFNFRKKNPKKLENHKNQKHFLYFLFES